MLSGVHSKISRVHPADDGAEAKVHIAAGTAQIGLALPVASAVASFPAVGLGSTPGSGERAVELPRGKLSTINLLRGSGFQRTSIL